MRIDWGILLTVFLAIVLARIAEPIFLKGSNPGTSTQVGAEINSPAVPVIVYTSALDQFIAEHHPNAQR